MVTAEKKMAGKKKKNKNVSQICIVTITGVDRVGIIARLANAMAEANINIVDVNQNIMEQYFVMTMACDMAESKVGMNEVQDRLSKIAKEMELNITFQNETIFKTMHRV
jgi:ACT domain-containing protein